MANTATEHAESRDEQETRWFKSLALHLLSNDLFPEQLEDEKYRIRRDKKTGDMLVTQPQRSWINTMLRKSLGHAKVAVFIFQPRHS